MNDVVMEVSELMTQLAKKKDLTLTLNLDGQLPMVNFDKDMIILVLTNILNNAIKFTKKGGITITTATKNNILLVSVRDTGSGILEEDLSNIFNRFRQGSAAKQKKLEGTGLGLAISQEIIKQHSGKIWAESKDGDGAIIYFLLPILERRLKLVKRYI